MIGSLVEVKKAPHSSYYARPPIGDVGVMVGNDAFLSRSGTKYHEANYITFDKAKNVRGLRREIARNVRTNIERGMVRGRQWIVTGSDPEIFAVDANGIVIPAWTFLPKKEETHGLHSNPYWDGFQVEWTIQSDMCYSYSVDYV